MFAERLCPPRCSLSFVSPAATAACPPVCAYSYAQPSPRSGGRAGAARVVRRRTLA